MSRDFEPGVDEFYKIFNSITYSTSHSKYQRSSQRIRETLGLCKTLKKKKHYFYNRLFKNEREIKEQQQSKRKIPTISAKGWNIFLTEFFIIENNLSLYTDKLNVELLFQTLNYGMSKKKKITCSNFLRKDLRIRRLWLGKYVTKHLGRGVWLILLQVAFCIEHLLNIVSVGASSLARAFATQFVVLQIGLQLLFPLVYNKVLGINTKYG